MSYNFNPGKNHRILPKFDENGEIDGCYALINHFYSKFGYNKDEDFAIL
jgi:hypothetical protein